MPIDERLRSKLERGEIELESTDGPGGRRDARARALIAAPQAKIWATITDYEHYKDFMPLTTVSEVKKREPNEVLFYTELTTPVKTIHYTIRLVLDEGKGAVDWKLVDGNLASNEGSWRLEPYRGGDETYVVYTCFAAPGFPLPGFLLNKLTQGTLPEVIAAVRKRVGDNKYGVKKGWW
jgi:ribosome-associated toxin RatA of RatAB toxin-antitoxin module